MLQKNSYKLRSTPYQEENLFYDVFSSPIDHLHILTDGESLKGVWFDNRFHLPQVQRQIKKSFPKAHKCFEKWEQKKNVAKVSSGSIHCVVIQQTKAQLQEYFSGQRQGFDLPLSPDGTEFQKRAWDVLRGIPYGGTRSYKEQAQILGDSLKARAVGTANGQNPISIIVPCHRVIAKNGSLSGFGGGISRKEFLLDLEKSKLVLCHRS